MRHNGIHCLFSDLFHSLGKLRKAVAANVQLACDMRCTGKPPARHPAKAATGKTIAISFRTLGAALAMCTSGVAFAQLVENPPLLPMNLTIFPQRDFASIEGFAKNADVLIQVRRSNGVASDAVGRTDDTGFLEVNHPGGVCWRDVTPDIAAGDTIRVTYRDTKNNQALVPKPAVGSGAAANTLDVRASQATLGSNNTVVVKGSTLLASGARIPLNRLEVRIVNPDFREAGGSRITRRDIRADNAGGRVDGVPGASGTLAYDSPSGNTFTAVFTGLNQLERDLAVVGQTRVMGWQQTTPAGDRLGMTIYEVGEVGGPGMGGCPFGPSGDSSTSPKPPDAPVVYDPAKLWNAAKAGDQPFLKDVTVFPERDFISIAGFPIGTELQVVVRRSLNTAVGTARGVVGSSGAFEVNHPGGVCWSGQTPNIQAGDWVDVLHVYQGAFNSGQTQRVINTRITKPAFINNNVEVRVTGVALDETNAPFALNRTEQRIVNPDFTATRIGRRDIRADTTGVRVDSVPSILGTVQRAGVAGSGEWRAIYSGLTEAEAKIAKDGQSRAMAWYTTNPNGDRFGMTISEFGEVGGPGFGGCPGTGDALIPVGVPQPQPTP